MNLKTKKIPKVIESDPLPNYVCMECWTKIDNFNDFHASVQAAQARYLSDLVKCERETNNFVDVLESVHLNIDTPNAESIDVLASVSDEATIKYEYDTIKSMFIEEESQELTNDSIEYDETFEDDSNEIKGSERSRVKYESGKKGFDFSEIESEFLFIWILQF